MNKRWYWVPAIVVGALACSTLETGTISLVFGTDEDPFTEPSCSEGGTPFCGPAPSKITISEVTLVNADGGFGEATTKVATQPYSGASTITLPQINSDNVDRVQATAYDSNGQAIIFGQTLPVAVGGIDGLTLDLFVQRKGQFAVLPAPLPSVPDTPTLAALFEGRYILVASQKSTEAFLYDLLLWTDVENSDGGQSGLTLPCTPLSIAPVSGTTFMLIICSSDSVPTPPFECESSPSPNDSDGGSDLYAFQYDLSGESCTIQVPAPSNNEWRSVAGGATVVAPNGDAFIVGGTRPKSLGLGPTTYVAKIGTAVLEAEAGTEAAYIPPFVQLSAPREGAAAVWSTGSGGQLVVVSGNQGKGTAGVELLGGAAADGSTTTGTPVIVSYVNDPTQGEGAVMLDDNNVLVAGGTLDGKVAPMRTYATSCPSVPCQPTVIAMTPPGTDGGEGGADGGPRDAGVAPLVPLLTAQGFAEPDAGALYIGAGSAKGGDTQAFWVTSSGAGFATRTIEVPLRVKRKGATALQTPVPSVVVVGGDTTMESFIP